MKGITIRLDDEMFNKLDALAKEEGYKKSSLLVALLRDFLKKRNSSVRDKVKVNKKILKMRGYLSVGGNSVKDSDNLYE